MRTKACVFLLFALLLSGFGIGQASAASNCQVDYTLNQWNTGFTAEVVVTNKSSQTLDGWNLTWTYADGQKITGKWNADVVQSGASVKASNPSGHWNGTLTANGGKASFGFQATHSGTNTVPVDFMLNGMSCNDSDGSLPDNGNGDDIDDNTDDNTNNGSDDDIDDNTDDNTNNGSDDDIDDNTDDNTNNGSDDDVDDNTDDNTNNGSDDNTTSTCRVDYDVNQWNSGFTSEVKVTNLAGQDVKGWALTWTFANGQSVTGRWNADVTQSGTLVTASNPESNWNGTLRANGGSASFGFQATHTGVNKAPVDFKLNGAACTEGSMPNGGDDTNDDNNNNNDGDDDDDTDYSDLDPMSACPAEASGDIYQDRFMDMWCDIHDPANGYFSPQGVPYHSVETLIIEAPDHGHETTSEAYSYWLWLEGMYGSYTGDWRYLDAAWSNMEKYIIPTHADQPTNSFHNVNSPATYAGEWPTPNEYPSPLQNSVPVGKDPIGQELASTYNTWDIYGMHWLIDVDNTYGYGRRGDGTSAPSYINTFQRGEQESVWETVPHPSWESFDWGGRNGFLDLFIGDNNYARQWRYTNAPDADARVVQAMYWAKQAADAQGGSDIVDALVAKSAKMGDYLRYSMFDKYFKEIGCQSLNCPGMSGKDSAHYLLSWYYSWGGAADTNAGWTFRIGSSHNHFGYQNPMAAWVLSSLENFIPKSPTAGDDWENSLIRQLEFYRWLQSPEGAIAGGATNCVNGNYSAHPAGTSTFYGMAYDDHPVYHDPGSNTWFGWQAWSMERVAELYYLTGDSLAQQILDDWVPFAMNNTELTSDDFSIPGELDWKGQPDTWTGAASFTGNPGLSVTIKSGSQDLGIVACLAKTLAYYSAGKREHAGREDVASRDMAFALMDRMWAKYRDDKGVSVTEARGDYERMDDPVFIPAGWSGIMGNGATIDGNATFLSIRDFYLDDPMYETVRAALDAGRDPEFNYHRFWAQAEVALANAELDRLFP